MSSDTSYIKKSLVYWAQVAAAATAGNVTYTVQNGPGVLTGAQAASVYNITMPANFTVPINRRMVVISAEPTAANPGLIAGYDVAASAANTVVVRGYNTAGAGGVADVDFEIEIYAIEMLP